MKYNQKSRKENAALAMSAGLIKQATQAIIGFIYRTIFVTVLAKEYLGINGLFSNILGVFSLVELGMGSVIIYRMYEPMAAKDTDMLAALVRFYGKIYKYVFLAYCILGLCIYPILDVFVNPGEVPSDVNISAVYFLFLAESAVSYLYSYKSSVLVADQKAYINTFVSTGIYVVMAVTRIVVLLTTHNYMLVLISGLAINVLLGFGYNEFIGLKNKDVFSNKQQLDPATKKSIFKDTEALLCHSIGEVVVTSTDNIILSKFVSLVSVGLYSNYSMLTSMIRSITQSLLSSFVPSIGNFVISNKEQTNDLYKKLLFAAFWVSSFTTVCLFCFLNPFINLWLDKSFLLSRMTVAVICFQYYLQTSRMISGAFINASGLFVKDKIRPLIEASINLIVSIILAKQIGITGVFIGTCVSGLVTYYWREPYLLYKNGIINNIKEIIIWYCISFFITAIMSLLIRRITFHIATNWSGLILACVICTISTNGAYYLMFRKSEQCIYFVELLKKIMAKIKNRIVFRIKG